MLLELYQYEQRLRVNSQLKGLVLVEDHIKP